ncbi:hypothetical protein Btru_064428 [Bulinus truncatus]|nr:hypothetical protein Btru_064428 [Bulinus truncatus]
MDKTGTYQLKVPALAPCSSANDLTQLKDDTCNPAKCTRQSDTSGLACCQSYKTTPNVWADNVVSVGQIKPENFNYDTYRYQLYAQPIGYNCHGAQVKKVPNKLFDAPTTDVRALRQTMYIPVVPSKPGGERQVTFPMTPQTMGQPDVTTACCVPVIPCYPGFQNMTSHIYPDPRVVCDTYNRCNPAPQMAHRRTDICASNQQAMNPLGVQNAAPAPQQFMVPPSNMQTGGCCGFPPTFPPANQLYGPPGQQGMTPQPEYYEADRPPGGQSPVQFQQQMGDSVGTNFGCTGYACQDAVDDGFNITTGNKDAVCTSNETFRFTDRAARAMVANFEPPDKRDVRLRTMYGSYGSYLLARVTPRRCLQGPSSNITTQGNGFSWCYPKSQNNLCYVLERNRRC